MRKLTPYEYNQLIKYNKNDIDINAYGQMPVEYITGFCEFLNRDFIVNQSVLIPRIETEELVQIVLKYIHTKNNLSILEIGTGSGVIGISIYLESKGKDIKFTITDISKNALEVSLMNLEKYNIKDINLIESDLFSNINGQYDIIIANLPYIPKNRKLDSMVSDFEPEMALYGGYDGFCIIKKFLSSSKNYLNKKGCIFLEVDDTHTDTFFREFKDSFNITNIKDSFNKNRFVVLETKNA